MKKALIILSFVTVTLLAFAGPVQELMELAESAFIKGDYLKAKQYYVDIINLQSTTDKQRDDARYNINVCQNHINEAQFYSGYNHASLLFKDKKFTQSRNVCISLLKYGKYKSKTNNLIQQCNDSINDRVVAQHVADSIQQLNQLREEYNSIIAEAFTYYENKQYLDAIVAIREANDSKYNPLGEIEPIWVDICRNIYKAQQRGEAITPEFACHLLNAIEVGNISNGIARIVYRENNVDSTLYISTSGQPKIRIKGHSSDDFHCKYLGTRYSNGYGYYDVDGQFHSKNEIQNDNYIQDVREFSDGMAPIQSDNKWGYINQDLKVVIKPQYDFVTAFSEGRAFVRKKGKWSVIDKYGNTILSKLYPAFQGSARDGETGYYPRINNSYYSDGKIWVQTIKFHNILADLNGNTLLDEGDYNSYNILHNGEPLFDWFGFSDGLMIYRDNIDKYGYLDANGKIVILPKYDLTYGFKDGLAAIKIDDKWGFIDKTGNITIQPAFDDVSREGFSEGLCAVKSNGKWGYVDGSGNWEISPVYDCPYRILNGSVGSFHNGFAAVALNGQVGYVDKFGNSTFDFQ